MGTIVTLTMNPALDIATSTDRVEPTHKLRCAPPRYDPGGGGINVARAVHALGGDAVAIFPVGGPAGEMIHHLLDQEGVASSSDRDRRVHPRKPCRRGPPDRGAVSLHPAGAGGFRARSGTLPRPAVGGGGRSGLTSSPAAVCRSASRRISMPEWLSSRKCWASGSSWIPPAPRLNRPAMGFTC